MWCHHIVRDFVLSKSQTKELEYLAYDELRVVMEWAMKWLPHFTEKNGIVVCKGCHTMERGSRFQET